jgi:hypothetical protein
MFSFNCKKLYLSKLAGSNHFKVARLQVAIAGLGRDGALRLSQNCCNIFEVMDVEYGNDETYCS